ncbi:MAG: flagellar hook-associated protein FlgL [Burkholderiaceae bacterium]
MRISTAELYQQGIAAMNADQAQIAQTQQQISSGQMINVPSDNPVGATEILQTSDSQSMNTQYAANQSTAQNLLSQTDSTLSQVTSVLQNVRSTLVSANNGSLTASDRSSLATTLQSQLSQLVSLANTQDAQGTYLFAGYQASSPPFTQTATGATYNSDDGVRTIQVSSSTKMPVAANGDQVFQRIRSGNGVFATGAALTNTGNASIDAGQVTSPSSLTGDNYSIQFAVSGGQTTYTVTDTTTGQTVNAPAASNSYTAGSAISFDGMQVTVSGTPANGDSFSVDPSQNQSVFTSIQQAITALQTSASSSNTGALGGLATSLQNIDQAMTQVSTVQSGVGANENTLTSLGTINSATNVQDTAAISSLQTTNLAQAATNLAQEETGLSAAELTLTKVTGTDLFSYLPS